VSFHGKLKLGSLSVLGKGYVGIVILGKKGRKQIAIKISRTDSQRKEMKNEARLQKIANKVGVGPLLITKRNDFVVMEYLDGEKISLWIKEVKGKGSVLKIKTTIRKILEDCYKLDKIGLDHGELSNISKHVIVGKSKTTIIDFESSSIERKVSNVTSATQGIYIGTGISKIVKQYYKVPTKNIIIKSLRSYKQNKTRQNFEKILKTLKLENVN